MKTRIILFLVMLLLGCNLAHSKEAESGKNSVSDKSINVFTTPELNQLVQHWASEYRIQNPDITIQISEANSDVVAEKIKSDGAIGFIINFKTTSFGGGNG
ncbi:MAG: hypothetical protein WAO52_12530 [Prolixibacteraceae bacterium]